MNNEITKQMKDTNDHEIKRKRVYFLVHRQVDMEQIRAALNWQPWFQWVPEES